MQEMLAIYNDTRQPSLWYADVLRNIGIDVLRNIGIILACFAT